jgi:hypothetical protein
MALDDLRTALEEAKARYADPERVARAERAARRAKERGIRHQTAKPVEVKAGHVAEAAAAVAEPDDVVKALAEGCARGKPDRTVLVELEHLERLVAACSS